MSGENFGNFTGSAEDAFAIVTNDTTDLTKNARAIYVGVTGNIICILLSGAQVTFNAVPAGSILPVAVKRVLATGTTATNLIGLI